MTLALFDIGIPGGTMAIAAGAGIFLILAAAAYILFRMLRKTVKMAFRMAVVSTVLFTVVVGGIALYWFWTGTSDKPNRPERSRQR